MGGPGKRNREKERERRQVKRKGKGRYGGTHSKGSYGICEENERP